MTRHYTESAGPRIRQGDILRDVEHVEDAFLDSEKPGYLRVESLFFPYIVVLSQDCDLKWDVEARNAKKWKPDKQIESILVCPAYDIMLFAKGEHLKDLAPGRGEMRIWNVEKKHGHPTTDWKTLIQNKNPRYHHLEKDSTLPLPELIVDFKHFYTIPRSRLYRLHGKCFVGAIRELYREDLNRRFANFLSRIGLPEDLQADV
jgi:hypothetical protein